MTADVSKPNDTAMPKAATTAPAITPDQAGEHTTDASSANQNEGAEREVVDKSEPTAAPESEMASRKKSAKAKPAKGAKRKDPDAKAQHEQGREEDAAKTAATASPDGAPNLRCLKIIREAAPPLPPGILPPEIDKMFPDAATRGAPVCALLAATAAAAGHAVSLPGGKGDEQSGCLGLRIAVVSDEHSLSSVMAPVMQSAYAVQADETKNWMVEREKETGAVAFVAFRQRLYRQTATNAALLGLGALIDTSAMPIATPAAPAERPCFVLRDPVPTLVKQMLATASKAMLIVDGTKMPTMAGWAANFLVDLADLLNDANAGELLELADPLAYGAVRMRGACISVIGALGSIETFGLYKANAAAFASTVFVPVTIAPKTTAVGAAERLKVALGRLRALQPGRDGKTRRLHLSADARKMLDQLKRRLMRASNDTLPPLTDVFFDAANLALRIAGLLHLLDYAVGNANQLPTEIDKAVTQRAVDLVEQYALPAARSVLGPASIEPTERDARRVLSFAQQNMALEEDVKVRELHRHLRRGMGKMELGQAIRLLVSDGLLSPKAPGGNQAYTLHPLVFAPENRLPDLASDSRRPKH